jgi:hypothetical protein
MTVVLAENLVRGLRLAQAEMESPTTQLGSGLLAMGFGREVVDKVKNGTIIFHGRVGGRQTVTVSSLE